MKHTILITNEILNDGIDLLKEKFEVIENYNIENTLDETIKKYPNIEAIVGMMNVTHNEEFLSKFKNLKIIANYSVGYNNIDLDYCKKNNIILTNTPGVLTDATADMVMTLLLSASRKIIPADKFIRNNKFDKLSLKNFMGKDLGGATIGIIGLGRIGLEVAKRAAGFKMNIIYNNRNRNQMAEQEFGFKYVDFNTLVKTSDFVVPLVPYSEKVHHLFNREIFDLMKKDAIFINAGRGKLMDENYLAQKLETNELFAAGLDVFEYEPKVCERLKKLDNCVMTPHIASATYNTRYSMAKIVLENIEKVLNNEKPITQVL